MKLYYIEDTHIGMLTEPSDPRLVLKEMQLIHYLMTRTWLSLNEAPNIKITGTLNTHGER